MVLYCMFCIEVVGKIFLAGLSVLSQCDNFQPFYLGFQFPLTPSLSCYQPLTFLLSRLSNLSNILPFSLHIFLALNLSLSFSHCFQIFLTFSLSHSISPPCSHPLTFLFSRLSNLSNIFLFSLQLFHALTLSLSFSHCFLIFLTFSLSHSISPLLSTSHFLLSFLSNLPNKTISLSCFQPLTCVL